MVTVFFADSDLIGSNLIRAFTWSEYSHVGFIHNGTVIDSRWSAGGVTQYPAAELYAHYPRIQTFVLDRVPNAAIEYAIAQVGKPYDWTALAGLPFHRDWSRDDRWFCSELVAASCLHVGVPVVNKPTHRVTPQDLLETMVGRATTGTKF